jgi:hypothetical protein
MTNVTTEVNKVSALQIFRRVLINRRDELYITIIIMLMLMLFSAIMIYLLEHHAQPEAFSSVSSALWWAAAALTTVGYGDIYPITVAGKVFAALIAICGIGMFALPTSILGSGFIEEMEKIKQLKQTHINAKLIKEAFEIENLIRVRKFLKERGVEVHRKFIELSTLQNELNLSTDEIYHAIKNTRGLRLRNIHSREESVFEDMVIAERFPSQRSYGGLIKRKNKVTVINTTAVSEAAVGHFSSVLASMLNANYISNEYFNAGALMRERRHNFSSNSVYSEINFESDDVIPELREFCTDLKATIEAKSLVILFFSAAKTRPDVTLATGGKKGEKCYEHDSATFDDLSRLEPFCQAFNARLSSDFEQSLSDEIPINDFSPKRICQYIRKETGADVLTIRVNIKTLRWADIEVYYRFIDAISEVVQSHLLEDSKRMTS